MAGITFSNQYSVAGLDVDKISKVKEAINNYIKVLNKYADNLDTTKNTEWNALVSNAIKGSGAEQSAKSYITTICTQCKDQIKLFQSFVTALDNLQNNYKKQDTGCTTTIGFSSQSFGEIGKINVCYKPVIYLYPTDVTKLEIKVGNEKDLLSTYPKYNEGWKITAHPNGDLFDNDGNYYYSLFWDAIDTSGIDLSEGFVVEGKDVTKFLNEKLEYIGFNGKEINEFIIYWLPILEKNKYNYIRFRQTEEVNEYMPLIFNKQPDTIIRVIMDFKALDEKIEVKKQELHHFERKGFTCVEWGGRNI